MGEMGAPLLPGTRVAALIEDGHAVREGERRCTRYRSVNPT